MHKRTTCLYLFWVLQTLSFFQLFCLDTCPIIVEQQLKSRADSTLSRTTPPLLYPRLKALQRLCGLITCIEHQMMAAAGSWLCVRCNNSQTLHYHKRDKRVSVSQAQFKYSSECKKILSEWRRGDKHTLQSSTLIHCIRRQNNSPAAISQRSHSRPRHLFFFASANWHVITWLYWSNLRCKVEAPAGHLT